jgi:16S rRNA (adenine1518-N6/adenine1519-N6)-dimethyltransferase
LASKHALNEELLSAIRAAAGRHRRLVANLPYNIASPLVIELLIEGVEVLAFTVQKEVADRLRAPAGSDAYGPLSVMAQMLSTVEVLRTLPPQAFWPAPKIDSALVRMRRHDQLGPRAAAFSRFVHELFSARRKTLRKAMSQAGYPADELIAKVSLDPRARPETLTPAKLHELFIAATPS